MSGTNKRPARMRSIATTFERPGGRSSASELAPLEAVSVNVALTQTMENKRIPSSADDSTYAAPATSSPPMPPRKPPSSGVIASSEPNPNMRKTAGVGYKRPPLGTRFKKGKSGNPTGKNSRTRKALFHEQSFEDELRRLLQTEVPGSDGRSTGHTGGTILARRIFEEAVMKDSRSRRMLWDLVKDSLRADLFHPDPLGEKTARMKERMVEMVMQLGATLKHERKLLHEAARAAGLDPSILPPPSRKPWEDAQPASLIDGNSEEDPSE